jgi:hypothetical protein
MNEQMKKCHHGLPDLQALDSTLSEETLALNSSSSSEFADEYLCDKVDLITTTISKSPPIIPLREERMSLGVECVFKAKGVGWSGVKKNRKKSKTLDSEKERTGNIFHKPLLRCFTDCAPTVYDNDCTPKNSNATKDRLVDTDLKALSYPEYVEYLLRCRAKKKEYIEHPYLELELSKDAEDALKRRIFTRQLEARQETFDSAAASDYIATVRVKEDEVRHNPSVSFDPLVRYYDINENDPSSTRIVYGATNDIDRLPLSQFNNKKSKSVSFAALEKMRLNRDEIKSSHQLEHDNIESDVGCCRYESILEESFMQSGQDNESTKTMNFMGVSDTTLATTTYCAVDIERFNSRRMSREAESLRLSRGSSIIDSVHQKGNMVENGTNEPLSTSSCIDVQYGESHDNLYECRDDSREHGSYHDERQSTGDACDSHFDSANASEDDDIVAYITTPREHRFHFYFPDQVRSEESRNINTQDVALQTSFAKSDSDATPLISNESSLEYVMKSSSMGSNSNIRQSQMVEQKFELSSHSHEPSFDLKLTMINERFSEEIIQSKVCGNKMQSPSNLSDNHSMSTPKVENKPGIRLQQACIGCSTSFTHETNEKCDETNIYDVTISEKKNDSFILSVPILQNQLDHQSQPRPSIGCSTSFEWKSHASPIKSFDQVVLIDSGKTKATDDMRQQSPTDSVNTLSQVNANNTVISVSTVQNQLDNQSQPRSSVGCSTSFEWKSHASPIKSFDQDVVDKSGANSEPKACADIRQQLPTLKFDSHVVSVPRANKNLESGSLSDSDSGEIMACDSVRQCSPTLKSGSHVVSASTADKSIECRFRSYSDSRENIFDDGASQHSPKLKSKSDVVSAAKSGRDLGSRSQLCNSVGCSTSFELDTDSSLHKSITDVAHKMINESSKASTSFTTSNIDVKHKNTMQSDRKTFEIGVQTSIQVSDSSVEGTHNKLPLDAQPCPMKPKKTGVDKNDKYPQLSSLVTDGRSESVISSNHRKDVSIQSALQLANITLDKVNSASPTAENHVFIRNTTPNLSFMASDYDSINNENKYDFTIPNSLSIDSCHSSLYSDEISATYSSHKEYTTNIRTVPPLLPRTSQPSKSNQKDAISFTHSLPKSLSLSSFHSANTSLSKASSMTHAEVEQCISYTLSELGRIHSMLDDYNVQSNTDSMSCTSESTEGRDALYYARQSKNEIAALHNLIEQQINKEKERSFNNGKLVTNGSCLSNNMAVAESSSFETMMSAKSQVSAVENQSLDRLILDVGKLCTDIETRIENIVNDTNDGL